MPDPKLEVLSGQGKSRQIPGPIGGKLIRRLIKTLREEGVQLPINAPVGSQILIACSGGLDSTALSLLIVKYGHKISPKVGLLHINHSWRGQQSIDDAKWVSELGATLGVPVIYEELDPRKQPRGVSAEEWARRARKSLFRHHAGTGGFVFTGHQADEVCETLVWRLFTGAARTHSEGILTVEGVELRPLLRCYKWELRAFLEEEGQEWREDPTNSNIRFLRAGFREILAPILNQQFPRWQEHFLRYTSQLKSQRAGVEVHSQGEALDLITQLLGTTGVRSRRVHLEKMTQWLQTIEDSVSTRGSRTTQTLDSIDLPQGWRARLETIESSNRPRIILEQSSNNKP